MQLSTQFALIVLALGFFSSSARAADKAQDKAAPPKSDAKSDTDAKDASAKTDSTEPPAAEAQTQPSEESDMTVHGLSWDLLGGGIPSSGGLVEGALGFSSLPRVAYHYSLDSSLSVGGMVSFDYGYWAPKIAFSPSLLLQAPVRYSIMHSATLSIGIRADPGLGFLFSGGPRPAAFGILLNVSGSVGYTIQDRFIVGGAVDVPIGLFFPTGGETSDLSIPLLFGPLFEFHVTPPLALTFNLRFGPHINTSGPTLFGLQMMSGIAYRL